MMSDMSDIIDMQVSDYCRDLAAAKAEILAACVRYNQVGKPSGSTVAEVRFSRSDGLTEAVDVSRSDALIAERTCPYCDAISSEDVHVIGGCKVCYCGHCQTAFPCVDRRISIKTEHYNPVFGEVKR